MNLDALGDFTVATGNKIIHSPDSIVNDAVNNTYMLARMLKGRGAAQVVQSGQRLKFNVQLTDKGTAKFYTPNQNLDPSFADVLREGLSDWRFLADHFVYTQQEAELNGGDPQTYYTNLLKSKRQACMTSMYNVMEAALWARPNATEMEGTSGALPYSIPALITANTNGIVPYTGADGAAWSTVENINGTTDSRWRNQQETYDSASPSTGANSLVNAFDRMYHKVRFESPANDTEYFENDRLSKMMIATNLDGINLYNSLTREHNDRLVGDGMDMGYMVGKVRYAGLQLKYISELDTAQGLLGSNNTAIPADKPLFYFLNMEYLYPIFHSNRYMVEEKPKDHVRQPFTKVVWRDTYYNLACTSRRRQGLVFAAGSAA